MSEWCFIRGGSRTTRHGASVTAVLLLAALLGTVLTGCAWLVPSPKTTYSNEQGETVTVDWRDFPGMGGTEAQAVLDGPTVEEGEARSDLVLAAVSAAIGEHLGHSDWNTDRSEKYGPATWSQNMENGYGGRSMLQLYNSHTWELEIQVPFDEWDALFDVAATAASGLGLTDSFEYPLEHPADARAARWMRDVTYSYGTEFLSVAVTDASLDEEALRDAKKFGYAIASVSLMFGTSAIAEAERAEFGRRAAPFDGLEHPELID